jgi:hypothetical protein
MLLFKYFIAGKNIFALVPIFVLRQRLGNQTASRMHEMQNRWWLGKSPALMAAMAASI